MKIVVERGREWLYQSVTLRHFDILGRMRRASERIKRLVKKTKSLDQESLKKEEAK